MSYQVKIPSCAFGGVGSIEKVKEVIKKEKSQKVVVFSDEGIKATGLLGILTARLDAVSYTHLDVYKRQGLQR